MQHSGNDWMVWFGQQEEEEENDIVETSERVEITSESVCRRCIDRKSVEQNRVGEGGCRTDIGQHGLFLVRQEGS